MGRKLATAINIADTIARIIMGKQKKYVNYHKYIHSRKWAEKSTEFRRTHPKCDVCGKKSECTHHTSYDYLGREPDRHLQALCHKCHNAHHKFLRSISGEPGSRATKRTVRAGLRLYKRTQKRYNTWT